MPENYISALRNMARGDATYRHSRHRIFVAAQRSGSDDPYDLHVFLRDKLLKLRKGEWVALAFDRKDWKALEIIAADGSGAWSDRYLPLTLDYISANAERVRSFYQLNKQLSGALFENDGEVAASLLTSISKDDEQSLFALRALAAQYSFDSESMVTLLKQRLQTDWLRKRYLYPLVFHAINAPSAADLEDFLSFVVTGEEAEAERATLRLLVRDDVFDKSSLGFKCYVSLLCHPYDACEMLLNHIEGALCEHGSLSADLQSVLHRLHREVASSRTSYLTEFASGEPPPFSTAPSGERLLSRYGLSRTAAETLARIVTSGEGVTELAAERLPKPLATLVRMRAQKYPVVDDFNYMVGSARLWWFSEAGRLLYALVTSLYMVPRTNPGYEIRDIARLVGFFGAVTPFFLTAPSAERIGQWPLSQLWGQRVAELETKTAISIREPSTYHDRMWIKAVQWALREPQRQMQLAHWLKLVRSEIRVAPAYLTGVDWSWLESVIKLVRLRPFVGNADGVYALLLFKIEERDRRSGALRTAIEPFVTGKTLPQVVDWLIDEYKVEAIAFVRFILEADDLLWLGLAPNRTAALTGRIYAIERCIRQFGYTDLMSESLFEQEWNTLNSALLLMSVNAGQFEIPWSVFTRDAAAKQLDLYTAAYSLEPGEDDSALLASARVALPYRYRNEKVVTYLYPNRLAPLVALILAVIEDFLAHPAFGLEVILSTRFRHDTMRREFVSAIEEVGELSLPGVWRSEGREIIDEVERNVLFALDNWLDARMHTSRPGKPNALFDIIPDQEEMLVLARSLDVAEGADGVISKIVLWIRNRLDLQMPAARQAFEREVPPALDAALALEKARLIEEHQLRSASIERVIATLHTALHRRAHELAEWFKGCPEDARPPLALAEVKTAADGLFEAYKERRKYRSYFSDSHRQAMSVPSEQVRAMFDLLREVFAAALKHTEPYSARTRISSWTDGPIGGLRFSNLTRPGTVAGAVEVAGDPYISLYDVVFREGNSGLAKIAALAATIAGHRLSIVAVRRRRSFHLYVPLWKTAETRDAG